MKKYNSEKEILTVLNGFENGTIARELLFFDKARTEFVDSK